jgi:hypothetical protein
MNWWGSGFIPIIIYSTFAGGGGFGPTGDYRITDSFGPRITDAGDYRIVDPGLAPTFYRLDDANNFMVTDINDNRVMD